MPEMDIDAAANEVVALLRQNDARAAAARLNALHDGQSAVVQEALDRYVSVRAATELETLRRSGGVAAADATTVNPMLDRLSNAERPPRMPDAAGDRRPEPCPALRRLWQHRGPARQHRGE